MASPHRKLLVFPANFKDDCPPSGSSVVVLPVPSPPAPELPLPPPPEHHPKRYSPSSMSVMAVAVATAILFGLLCAIIRRHRLRQNVSRSDTQILFHTRNSSLDEDNHGHRPRQVDHPIWLINTVGLEQSVINSIMVFEFKSGDGLVDATECTICLGDFQDGEDLRLLPKCNHAFHVFCIDTWLRSHKNCPLCRAPIVRDVLLSSSDENVEEPRLNNVGRGEAETREGLASVEWCNRAGFRNLLSTASENVDVGRSSGGGGGGGGSGCEIEVVTHNRIRSERSSSIDLSSAMDVHKTMVVDRYSRSNRRLTKKLQNVSGRVTAKKNGECSFTKMRRSSSDAGILSVEKGRRQTPIHSY